MRRRSFIKSLSLLAFAPITVNAAVKESQTPKPENKNADITGNSECSMNFDSKGLRVYDERGNLRIQFGEL
ncbi:hypothetical protein [Moellerella wisconsensis]|uniref:hypothetical protein n=1 Tax=Moellerella wisconsensis TaxID=158849 RepID=UPI000641671F|nr:hypothetical protein [Moellerella wisconsensis]KLN95690.1 hypothetical protein VK86_14375 [Moellerella wisconsensis]